MPLDLSIYRSVTPQVQQPEGPLDIMQKVATLRDSQALAQQRRELVNAKLREQQVQEQARQIMSGPEDMDTKIQKLYGVDTALAGDVQKSWDTTRKNAVELGHTLNENAGRTLAMYDPAKPDTWGHVQAVIKAMYQPLKMPVPDEYLGPPPDADTFAKWKLSFLSNKEQFDATRKNLETKEVLGPDNKTVTLQNYDKNTGTISPVTDTQGQPVVSPKTAEISDKAADNARQQANDAFSKSARERELAISAAHLALAKKAAVNEQITPQDIQGVKRTTLSGTAYLDMGDFEGQKERSAARAAAQAAGIPSVDAKTGSSLRAIDSAKQNAMEMWRQVSKYLPKDAAGRIIGGPENTLAKVFQTHPELGAYGAWRTAAIQQVQALAEPGMGLRINQAEINAAMENDIPQITDDAATGAQRLKNLFTMLNNKERDALTRDRSTLQGGIGPKEGDTKPITDPGYPPSALQTFKNGKWVRTR